MVVVVEEEEVAADEEEDVAPEKAVVVVSLDWLSEEEGGGEATVVETISLVEVVAGSGPCSEDVVPIVVSGGGAKVKEAGSDAPPHEATIRTAARSQLLGRNMRGTLGGCSLKFSPLSFIRLQETVRNHVGDASER